MVDGRFYGLASQRIRPQNGSQIRSRKPATGNRLPAISFVIGTGPMVRSSSEGFGRWAFAIDRRRRAPPWQNGYAERLIGSIRRECLDHVIIFSERHLRHLLLCYMKRYNRGRTHLSLEKDAPVSRAVDRAGHILLSPNLGRTAPPIWPDLIYDRHRVRIDGAVEHFRQSSLPKISN